MEVKPKNNNYRTLTKDKNYILINMESILMSDGRFNVKCRILDDLDRFILVDAIDLILTPNLHSDSYVLVQFSNGNIFFGPKEISKESFWEGYFEDNVKSKEILKKVFPSIKEAI